MEFRGLGVSRRPHRPYGATCKVSADLVVHGIRKSTFQHLTVNWNFNVPEMALKTLHFVQGLSRTPLLFIPRYYTNICFENVLQKQNKNSIIEQMEKNTKNIIRKLTFQCTRNGPQNPPFCPGSLQDTFIICSLILHQHIFRKYVAEIKNLENRKSENPKTQVH